MSMKKISKCAAALLLFTSLLLLFSSCAGYTYSESGLENFPPKHASLWLTNCMIPDNFLESYPYEDGGFEWYEIDSGAGMPNWYSIELALLYTVYDDETYTTAKQYCLENLDIDMDSYQEYCGYKFYQNQSSVYVSERDTTLVFWGYCDEKEILISIGTIVFGTEFQDFSFEEYIDEYFFFFNFEEGKIEVKPNSKWENEKDINVESETATETTT